MAKVPKSVYLNDELAQVIDALAASTGASTTKIVTAALIRYLLGDFPWSDPIWMQLTTALERGDLSLPQVLIKALEHRAERCENLSYGIKSALDENKQKVREILDALVAGSQMTKSNFDKAFLKADAPLKVMIDTITEPRVQQEEVRGSSPFLLSLIKFF